MATLIYGPAGSYYTTASVEEVKAALDRGDLIDVWWFAAWGQRFSERAYFGHDSVQLIRSESDDG